MPARDLITIVGNLIDNALDAAAGTPAPTVHVAVEATDAALRIAVGDSGAGPRDGDRVFDLGVTTKAATGHGIGLALVRQTVTRLGGGIRVHGLDVRGHAAARRCERRAEQRPEHRGGGGVRGRRRERRRSE